MRRSSASLRGAFALAIVSSVMVVGCSSGNDEEMGETEGYLLAGRVLKASEVAGHVRAAGFPENTVGKMTCVAKWESSFFERAKNGSHYGLFQIAGLHLGHTRGCPSSVEAVYEPGANAKCAFAVYKAQGIGAWEAYKSHKRECDGAAAPHTASTPTPRPTETKDEPAKPDIGAPKDEEPQSSSSNDDQGGGCWSATLQEMTPAHACVRSASSGVWFQCDQGQWYRGGDDSSGAFGACACAPQSGAPCSN